MDHLIEANAIIQDKLREAEQYRDARQVGRTQGYRYPLLIKGVLLALCLIFLTKLVMLIG